MKLGDIRWPPPGLRRQEKTHLCKILQVMGYIQSPKFTRVSALLFSLAPLNEQMLGYGQILTPDAHYRHYKKIRHLLGLTIVSGGRLVKKQTENGNVRTLGKGGVCVCVCFDKTGINRTTVLLTTSLLVC